MSKGVLYYTDNELESRLFKECQDQLRRSWGYEILAVSLKPIPKFGRNIFLNLKPSYPTMLQQIIIGLEAMYADYVFFTEHDVLYHYSHFAFEPKEDDVFYYNMNSWRWDYPKDRFIRYEELTSLSQLCVNRKFALEHFRKRLKKIKELELDKIPGKEPDWARKWGYEPGLKKTRNGGFSNEKNAFWSSPSPNIDIRHKGTFSPPKVTLESFKHPPHGWKETTVDKIYGWNKEYLWSLAS